MIDDTLFEAEEKMDKAVSVAKDSFAAIRTGRAHPGMFARVVVEYYGTVTPLNQLAGFTVADARMIVIGVKGIGAREGERTHLGSVTNRVLHEAGGRIPVLVV